MIAEPIEIAKTRLPQGYVARPFEERDREVMVAARNAELGPMEQSSAEEWRGWEQIAPDPDRLRFTVAGAGDDAVALAELSRGGAFRTPDGALNLGIGVVRAARGRGVGSALIEVLEAEARRRGAPRALSQVRSDQLFAVEWATRRGFTEIGRRIDSYRDLASFDPAQWSASIDRTTRDGIRFLTVRDELARRGEDGAEAFHRELYALEGECWDDVPFPSPTPHWAYEMFRRMGNGPNNRPELSVLAIAGDRLVGMTMTIKHGERDAYTVMTGTARAHRNRGIGLALKVEALARAKAAGLRALMTTNDEPNKAMRGINAKLGYEMLPARISLEKRF
ncbi:MAG: GNAT family N-acetyltransferase [Chloroflexota bacterium]|nr:GNAT family N-acetyltransferase [Chloroflexota bacterium]